MSSGRVSVVVLAAGGGRRMGRTKQLLELRGKPLVRYAVESGADSCASEVIVVTGHDGAAVAAALQGAGDRVRVVHNPDFERGQAASLQVGLAEVDAGSEAAVVLLADQPGVGAAEIDRVVAVWRERGGLAARAVYVGEGGAVSSHPVLLSRSLWPEIGRLAGDHGARSVLQRHAADVTAVEIDRAPPPDVDTPEDLARAERVSGTRRGR